MSDYAQIHDRNWSNDEDIKANQVKFNFKQKWIQADQNILTFNQFRVAARTKKETYHILTITWGKYLPPVSQTNVDYISDILPGNKNVSRNRSSDTGIEIKEHSRKRVPKIESLIVNELIQFARKKCNISMFLSVLNKNMLPVRTWFLNISRSFLLIFSKHYHTGGVWWTRTKGSNQETNGV